MNNLARKEQLARVVETIAMYGCHQIPSFPAILIIDQSNNISFANEATEKILGLKRAVIIGKKYNKLGLKIQTPRGEPVKKKDLPFNKVIESGEPLFGTEYVIERPNKTSVHVSMNITPLSDPSQKEITGIVVSLRDITESKQFEEKLKGQAYFLEVLIDAIPLPVFYKDKRGLYLGCNKAFKRYLGLTQQQIVGKTVYDVNPKELADKHHKMDNELFSHPGIQTYEALVRHADNSIHDVVFNKATFLGMDGSVSGIVGIIFDVTDRKRAEEALMSSEKKLRDLTSVLGQGVYVLDKNKNLTFLNPKGESILGWKEQEVLGKSVHEIFHYKKPDGSPYPADECPVIGVIDSGKTYITEEDAFIRKDGTMFPVSYIATPLRENRKITGSVTVFTDITERKHIEEELKFKSLLLDSATDTVFVLALDGKFIYVNEAAYKTRGYTKEEFLSMSLHELDPPEYAKKIKERIGLLMKKGSAIFESAHIKKDGTVMPVEIHARIIEHGGEKVIVSVIRDITERKQAEEKILESENRLRAVIDNEPACVKLLDSDGTLLEMNPAGLAIIEADSLEQVVGKPIYPLVVPQYQQAFRSLT